MKFTERGLRELLFESEIKYELPNGEHQNITIYDYLSMVISQPIVEKLELPFGFLQELRREKKESIDKSIDSLIKNVTDQVNLKKFVNNKKD